MIMTAYIIMPRDEFHRRKTKKNTAKDKYDKNGKFNSRAIRKKEAQLAQVRLPAEPKEIQPNASSKSKSK